MKPREFSYLFKKGGTDILKSPLIVLPGAFLWLVSFVVSKIAGRVGQLKLTAELAYVWLIASVLIMLCVLAFVFAGMIGMSFKSIKNKNRGFFESAVKFWFKNFMIILIIVALSVLVRMGAHYGSFYLGKALELNIGAAQFLFVLLYFIGLVGILIWFSFSSFFLVYENKGVKGSIKMSFGFVRRNYLDTLVLSVALFVILFFVNKIQGNLGNAIEYLLLIPYFVLVIGRFVLKKA